jgi:sugar O-acyltransferase (sialic acid O-acetyltransferase NeuD family)
MNIEKVCIVGAGGHARVVADALISAGSVQLGALCFADDSSEMQGRLIFEVPVTGPVSQIGPEFAFHVAIGAPDIRERLQRQLSAVGARPLTILHPRAIVSPYARIGAGSFIAAGAIVGPLAAVGEGVIVNHGAVVDHDCEVGAWSHIAPQATLGGAVRVGQSVLIGSGARVLPGKCVGTRAVVGAGAVVVRDVAEGIVSRGVPARDFKR